MIDDWMRSLIGGVAGGAVTGAIAWLKLRDDVKGRLRDAYLELFAVADLAIIETYVIDVMVDTHGGKGYFRTDGPYERATAITTRISMAVTRLKFLESRESCLRKVQEMKEALNNLTGIRRTIEVVNSPEYRAAYDKANDELNEIARELMLIAKADLDI